VLADVVIAQAALTQDRPVLAALAGPEPLRRALPELRRLSQELRHDRGRVLGDRRGYLVVPQDD
jgi:hypothetical protein